MIHLLIFLFFLLSIPFFTYHTYTSILPHKTCNVLSFSGGGAFGAVEIGMLQQIHLPEYDILAGVSVGGLNAGFLSFFNSPQDIKKGIDTLSQFYSQIQNSDIYTSEFFDIYNYWSYYNSQPLKTTITNILQNLSYTDYNKFKPTLIGTTNVFQGTFTVFNFPNYNLSNQIQILLATSAIPILFTPIIINDTLYVDGGLLSNEILTYFQTYSSCDSFNITYLSSHTTNIESTKIHHFYSYVEQLFSILIHHFDDPLSTLQKNCYFPKGHIHHYYVNQSYLQSYSILNMNYGKELLHIGNTYSQYQYYPYCI